MPDAPRQLRTDLPGAGPCRAVLWHQGALDEEPFPPEEWLAPEERAEFGSLGSEKRRREWLAARVALKDLLVRDGVVRRPTDAIVRKDDRGAPRLVVWEPDTFRYAELACAISHSAPLVLCAYLRGRGARVGVDVERRSWRLARLGRKFLSPGDRMLEKDDDRGDETVLWSFKESLSKLLGTGWSCGFRTISCVETAPGSCELADADGNRYAGSYLWFGQHAVAVVWDPGPGQLPPLRLPPRPWWERAARARRLRALRRRARRLRPAAAPDPSQPRAAKRLCVSACLLGVPCRWKGDARPCEAVRRLAERAAVRALDPATRKALKQARLAFEPAGPRAGSAAIELVPFCPELAAGLGCPRPPIELVQGDGAAPSTASTLHPSGSAPPVRALRVDRTGDATDALRAACEAEADALARAGGVDGFVLKARSPSCGLAAPLHDADGREAGAAPGLWAALARERFPGAPAWSEDDLPPEWTVPRNAGTEGASPEDAKEKP